MYPILGMDFISTHVKSINFDTNTLTFKDNTNIKLLDREPPTPASIQSLNIQMDGDNHLSTEIKQSADRDNHLSNYINTVHDVEIVPNTLRIKDVIREYLIRQRKENAPVAGMINHVMKDEPTEEDFQKLFEEFPQITDESAFTRKPKHKTKHYIKTKGQPYKSKPRRLDAENLAILKEITADLMQKGIIKRSKSNYAAPIVLVKKPGKKPRLCGDFSGLNKITVNDAYSMRHIHDVNLEIHGCKYFSKLDLVKAYNQIPMAQEDIHKTAIATPIGAFVYLRMPFGLCTAAQTFQRFIDEILEDIPSNFPYQDDVTVYSKTKKEHYDTLRKIFEKFSEYGVIINKEKSELCREKVSVLGYEISAEGIKPSVEKLEIVNNLGLPRTEAELHNFVGMVNYYNRFIPACSLILAQLYKLFTKKKKCRKEVQWTDESIRAFEQAKKALNQACLDHPDYSKEIAVMIDASDFGIGGVIQQLENDKWRPIQYFARKLSDTEKRYTTFGRELLAAFASIKKFRHHLEGREFTLFTDHKPLVSAVEKPHLNDKRVDREKRQLDFLCSMIRPDKIQHIPGKENIIADALSRAVNNIIFPDEVELLEIHKEQQADSELLAIHKDTFVTRKLQLPNGDVKLIYNTETGYDRLCIPEPKRKEILLRAHNTDLAHRGLKATKRYIMQRYYWPNMSSDIIQWVNSCVPCALAKSGRKTSAPLGKFEANLDRFHTVHIDIITMDSEQNGCKHVLTMIDRTTSWPEAVPLNSTDAKTVAWHFVNTWVKNHGVPKVLVSDQGKQFESQLFQSLCELLNTRKCRTTTYHPQSNAKVERLHKTLKEALMAMPSDWYTALPIVLLALRNTHKEDMNASPANLVYGRDLIMPNELVMRPDSPKDLPDDFAKKLGEVLSGVKSQPTKQHGEKESYIPKGLMTAKYVYQLVGQFAKKGARYTGPYEVITRDSKTFQIKKDKDIHRVFIDQLKPAKLSEVDLTKEKSIKTVEKTRRKRLAKMSKGKPAQEATGKDSSSSKADEQPEVTIEVAHRATKKGKGQRGRPKKLQSAASNEKRQEPVRTNRVLRSSLNSK